MSRSALRRLHRAASVGALALVAAFLASTVTVEALGDEADVAAVKGWIARALVLLAVAMATAGVSGRRLAGGSRAPAVRRKLRRMQIVGATGLLVLAPCALVLAHLSADRHFEAPFAVLQAVELVAGGSNLTLLVLNARDGMAMRARRGRARVLASAAAARLEAGR